MTLTPPTKQAISRHPLFPAIAALWLAALLGVGSFVIPSGVVESLVSLLRIDRVVPAAAAPLGMTARLLIAAVFGLAGAVGGYLAARVIARTADDGVPSFRRRTAGDSSFVLSEPADAPVEDAPSDDNDDLARLAAARAEQRKPRRPLVVSELSEPAGPDDTPALAETVAPVQDRPAPEQLAPEQLAFSQSVPLQHLEISELVGRIGAALEQRRERAAEARRAEEAAASAPVAPAPAPILPPVIEIPAPVDGSGDPEPLDLAEEIAGEDAQILPPLSAGEAEDEDPADDAPYTGGPLSMPSYMAPEAPAWVDEAEEEATLASLLPPKRPTGRPFNFAREEAERAASELNAQAAEWALPDPEPEPDEDELPEEEAEPAAVQSAARKGYSSLLGMKVPVRQPQPLPGCVRVEDGDTDETGRIAEPIVVFPGQAVPPPPVLTRLPGTARTASPAETEEALRDALAALQSMSGHRR